MTFVSKSHFFVRCKMKVWVKVLIITLLVAIPSFILGPLIWPKSPDMSPTPLQLPFFIFLSVLESLLLGLGISFIIFGFKLLKKSNAKNNNLNILAYLSIVWLLVSWWPHDNLHAHNALDMQGLLYIEYRFHLTLIIASVILAYYFLNVNKR